MKRTAIFLLVLFMLICGASLMGCGSVFGIPEVPELPDYNADIQIVLPESIAAEHFKAEEGKTYYTSPGLSLWAEVNGEFLKMDYFSLEGNKRVYDNLYFYEDDYFYIVTDDYKDLYASLGDSADTEYAEEEKEQGYDIQINVKKAGIYKLIFDTETLKFDMEYKADIETPVYYTMKSCSIFSLATEWVEMSVNPENNDEFVINGFHIDAGKTVSFFNRIHTSNYKVTLNEACEGKYGTARKAEVTVNVGGEYNVYVNSKTYEVRLELTNPETAEYSCVYYDGSEFIELQPAEGDAPYIFRQRINVDTKYTTQIPDFHTASYRTYALTVIDSEYLMSSGKNYYFKQMGEYELVINLKTFEITALPIPE